MRRKSSLTAAVLLLLALPCLAEPTDPHAASSAPKGPAALSGTILERIDAASYSYLHVKTDDGEVWAAVPQTSLEKGAAVVLENISIMDGFESKSLGRHFDQLYFATLQDKGHAAGGISLPPGHAPVGGGAAPAASEADEKIQVEKAKGPDARTVAEVFASRKDLSGKTVEVRGKVVKFTAEIMNRNWVHLRDGSGSAAEHDNDLTVTTSEKVAVGDVVTLRGKLAIDRDFGAGYSYEAIVEEAEVVP